MKKIITLACLLCFAGCAYAEMYQVPGSYRETTTEITVQDGTTVDAAETTKQKKSFKLFKKKRKDYNPSNTYWNFGRPPFWTGSI